ncbi:cobyrinic acid a,c-diamide synthase [Clostridium collagenovorans DSM 3089]|uniref:Cobyrinate a,c-diamide synthase n=1 Tax=Clostridium collagenovorans DSM 3089 TaxID=1121306 RepID=A0A1M5TWN5_9CLOT|nr:cobyrinate a,c-diamide synthase [Clostridium collagenovorans]SHH55071.1 cobyrinic acid a,c-diamide synthase [Clostridium collagenovorans DSM 3089]
MKGILISSNASGGGKTTITLGLMKAFKNRGYKIQGYKVGPDYIDPAFHSKITGTTSRNLDLHLMGEEGVKASFSRGKGDLAIVEGVMGFYDGKGIGEESSTYEIAELLNLPTVLVLSPKAQVATLCAQINGIRDYKNANIAGVILNNISPSYYMLLKKAIETNCNMPVFGYLPTDNRLSLESRHLGLVQSSEIKDIEEKIEICAKLLEEKVDLDRLYESFVETKKYKDTFHLKRENLRIGVTYDKAFSFYYKENLELLEEIGEVIYFSPMMDKELPKNLDFIYFGGGYPEVFMKELKENISMRESILSALENGVKAYAECGGLMYLTQAIYSLDEEACHRKDLVSFYEGSTYMSTKLQNFGYAKIVINKENDLLPLGLKINCHEFHKSYVDLKEEKIYEVRKESFTGKLKTWQCGYVKNNTLGAYAHVHFFGNLEFINELLK